MLGCVWPISRYSGGWDYSRGWPDQCRPFWSPWLSLGERRGRGDVKQGVGVCVGLGGGEYVPMYAAYLPRGGRYAQNEPLEKSHVNGEHTIPTNVLARELVGVTVPKKEV